MEPSRCPRPKSPQQLTMADVNAVEEGNKVVLTGENPFIRLSDSPDGDETTNASFWRILFCPAGPGALLHPARRPPPARPLMRAGARRRARALPEERPLSLIHI